jgi:hypothetical protein
LRVFSAPWREPSHRYGKPGVFNLLPIRESGERLQTDIDPDCGLLLWERRRIVLDRETGIPLLGRRPPDREGLDRPFNRTVEDDLHVSDLREMEMVSVEFESSFLTLRVRETIVSPLPLEPGESRFFLPCFYASEEGFEAKIYPNLNILECLSIDLFQFWPILLPLSQDLVGFRNARVSL